MATNYLEIATKMFQDNIGKYVTIFHKWQHNREDNTFATDECVVKILNVTPRSIFVDVPYIEVQFANGKKAKMEFTSEYQGQLLLLWDYQRLGRLFNDFFVKNDNGSWVYTYPDNKCGESISDYFLTTGIHQVKFYSSISQEKAAIVDYMSHLEMANSNREEKRIRYEEAINSINNVTPIETRDRTTIADLDRLFHTA